MRNNGYTQTTEFNLSIDTEGSQEKTGRVAIFFAFVFIVVFVML